MSYTITTPTRIAFEKLFRYNQLYQLFVSWPACLLFMNNVLQTF